uniref:Down syndrome critical region protein 3 homolog isoform X6 n=1 Tax=Elaeis guineensis var. tenera TaxID=51953 RepID=A0A8N4F6P7_ELAGV|nr:Down syndrome critical region protein 3 homolog isoform X6 [Elaeis guineensis]
MSIELKLSRPSRVYRPGESVEGKIITTLTTSVSYHKILVTVNGTVNLQVRGGVAGVIESLYSVVKPLCIIKKSTEVASSAGKLAPGRTEIPFSFSLSSQENGNHGAFYETFHGGNISIQYLITADIMRGYLHKSLSATLEFIVESDKVLQGHQFHLNWLGFILLKTPRNINYCPNCLQSRTLCASYYEWPLIHGGHYSLEEVEKGDGLRRAVSKQTASIPLILLVIPGNYILQSEITFSVPLLIPKPVIKYISIQLCHISLMLNTIY